MTSPTFVLPDHDTMVANIRAVYDTATTEQRQAGLDWYADSYRVAHVLGARYGVGTARAAGVLAALSPRQGWGANVNMASRLIALDGDMTSGYLSAGLDKGNRILTADVNDIPHILGGLKTRAFYMCIASKGNTDAVCIDRHAFSIAVGARTLDAEMPKLTPKRYAALVAAYVEASQDVTGADMQAITWVAWRARFHKEGAFDSYNEI